MDLLNFHSDGDYDIKPLFCGFEDCGAGYAYGPAVRDYYLIHCVLKGAGIFRCGDKTWELSKGNCFMIFPGKVTFYQADEETPWSYLWLAYTGKYAGILAKRVGLSEEKPVFGGEKILRFFKSLYFDVKSGVVNPENSDTAQLSVLYSVFSSLPHETAQVNRKDVYVSKVKNYVESMYAYPISIERMSQNIGLDRRYLCSVFKLRTGLTLQEYIIGYRMEKARELLYGTGLSVGDVARSVGYADVYNFSKMFKAKYGVSPLKFRETAGDRNEQPPCAAENRKKG